MNAYDPAFWLSTLCLTIWAVLTFARSSFWRFRTPGKGAQHAVASPWPSVVAVIPARDEAAHIGGCVTALLNQDYQGTFDVIVVDDASADATTEVALRAAAELAVPERLHVLPARTLPEGWSGKVWAQFEGCELIRKSIEAGDEAPTYIWFTDADIIHRSHVLTGLVSEARGAGLVLNSHMVHLRCKSLAERALVPAFVFFFAMLYPFEAVSNDKRRVAAAAGGSMLLNRVALDQAGGMSAVRSALIDDCALGQMMKGQGPIRLALGQASFSIRPYPGFIDIWRMISRTAYTQLRYSPVILLGTVLGLIVTYLAPPLLALFAHGIPALFGGVAWLLMAVCFAPIAHLYRRSLAWGVALPGIASFFLAATIGSAWQHWRGRGGTWKNRHQGSAINAAGNTLNQPR